jgi:hypothetical protein
MTAPAELSDGQIAGMSDVELERWSEAESEGPNDDVRAAAGPAAMTSITVRMPNDLLSELKGEAAVRGQPYQRYMKDLLLLALRQVQAADRRPPKQAQVRLTDDQLRELTEHGQLIVRLSLNRAPNLSTTLSG